jgi:hypothetical protein
MLRLLLLLSALLSLRGDTLAICLYLALFFASLGSLSFHDMRVLRAFCLKLIKTKG